MHGVSKWILYGTGYDMRLDEEGGRKACRRRSGRYGGRAEKRREIGGTGRAELGQDLLSAGWDGRDPGGRDEGTAQFGCERRTRTSPERQRALGIGVTEQPPSGRAAVGDGERRRGASR
ncbi:hypothetical protein BV20DRAFT_959989 [Pilatotrama ljubarskyi]|nr:hypothetical protein BV20DRAFT_959989 [Pilatotrama ljubarskyi]